MPSTGVVKNYMFAKGFGFIKPDDGGKDLFVHATALKTAGLETLEQGARVQFESEDTAKGPRAVNIALAG